MLARELPSCVSDTTYRYTAFGKNPLYKLRITTRASLNLFAKNIGFLDVRHESLLERGLDGAWEFNDVIPHQEQLVASLYEGPGRGSGPMLGPRCANRYL